MQLGSANPMARPPPRGKEAGSGDRIYPRPAEASGTIPRMKQCSQTLKAELPPYWKHFGTLSITGAPSHLSRGLRVASCLPPIRFPAVTMAGATLAIPPASAATEGNPALSSRNRCRRCSCSVLAASDNISSGTRVPTVRRLDVPPVPAPQPHSGNYGCRGDLMRRISFLANDAGISPHMI